jgi:hypothetical protein
VVEKAAEGARHGVVAGEDEAGKGLVERGHGCGGGGRLVASAPVHPLEGKVRAAAVRVTDDDLGGTTVKGAGNGGVDVGQQELAALGVLRLVGLDLLRPPDAGSTLHITQDVDLHRLLLEREQGSS